LLKDDRFDFADIKINACPIDQFKINSVNTNPFTIGGTKVLTNGEFYQQNGDVTSLVEGLAS